jgi:hypothetical protein
MFTIYYFSVFSVSSVAKICFYQCKKLLNCDVKTADSFACVFLYEKNENFFDNRNFRPIISAFKDLLLGVIMTAKGLAPLWAHLGEA